MTNDKDVKRIAKMLTDDPDVFNEMAVSTGAIAAMPGGIKRTKKRKKKRRTVTDDEDAEQGTIKKYFADPVTGQSKVKTKSGKSKQAGMTLFAGEKDEEPEDSLEESKDAKSFCEFCSHNNEEDITTCSYCETMYCPSHETDGCPHCGK